MSKWFHFKRVFGVTIIFSSLNLACWFEEEETPQSNLLDSGFILLGDDKDSGVSMSLQNSDGGFQGTTELHADSGQSGELLLDGGVLTGGDLDGGMTLGSARNDAGLFDGLEDGGTTLSEMDYVPLTTDTCADLCLARTQNSDDMGGCGFSWNSGDCETRCMEMAPFSELTQTAFAFCTLYDPLCYQTVDQCLLMQRYPWSETMLIPVTFQGSGFDAYNGFTVTVAIQSMANTYHYAPQQLVTDGAFEFQWDVDTNPNMSKLFLYYIDVDLDGHCDTSIDYGVSLQGVVGPDWDSPTILGEAIFDNNNHEFVCDYID